MVNPESPDEWWGRANEKQRAAELLAQGGAAPREIWMLCGEAVEYALKAVIMRRKRWNRWPERDHTTRQVYSHDLYTLAGEAGIDLTLVSGDLRTNWSVVLDWTRASDYDPAPMPRGHADDMYEATFARPNGVFTWLKSL